MGPIPKSLLFLPLFKDHQSNFHLMNAKRRKNMGARVAFDIYAYIMSTKLLFIYPDSVYPLLVRNMCSCFVTEVYYTQ
jgi:hypothetical protein